MIFPKNRSILVPEYNKAITIGWACLKATSKLNWSHQTSNSGSYFVLEMLNMMPVSQKGAGVIYIELATSKDTN